MGRKKLSKNQIEDVQNSKSEMKMIAKDIERLYLEKNQEEVKERIEILLEEHEDLREHIHSIQSK